MILSQVQIFCWEVLDLDCRVKNDIELKTAMIFCTYKVADCQFKTLATLQLMSPKDAENVEMEGLIPIHPLHAVNFKSCCLIIQFFITV